MAVISQSSFLFNEVLRRSLDPADKFIVEEFRNILDKVKLKSTVVIEMVNFTVTWQKMVLISVSESGSWSASLALFCLDQATSSVDTQRDELIQSIIRKEMNHCTVLTSEHCIRLRPNHGAWRKLSEWILPRLYLKISSLFSTSYITMWTLNYDYAR